MLGWQRGEMFGAERNFDEHRQKVYVNTVRSLVSEVVSQLIGQVQYFVQIGEPEELEFPSEITECGSEEGRIQEVTYTLTTVILQI